MVRRPGLFLRSLAVLTAILSSAGCSVGPGHVEPRAVGPTVVTRAEPDAGAAMLSADRLASFEDPRSGTGAADARASMQDPMPPAPPSSSQSKKLGLDRVEVEAFWIPAMWIQVNADSGTTPLSPDLDVGSGFGARIGMASESQGVGLLYTSTWFDESNTNTRAQVQQGMLDFSARGLIFDEGGARCYFRGAGDIGAAWFTSDGPYQNEVNAAAQLHLMLEAEFGRNFAVDLGIAGFVWGYPGETAAYGTFLSLGGKVIF